MSDSINHSRRSFLEKSAAVGAITIAPGILLHQVANAKPDDQPISDTVRWGMLIDSNKCVEDCTACVDACNQENGIDLHQKPEGQSEAQWEAQRPQWIRKVKLKDRQTGEITNLPMMCQHCEFPPCVDVCPTSCINFIENDEEEVLREKLIVPARNLDEDLYVSEILPTGRVMVKDENVCLHCGLCAERCPTGAWDMQKSTVLIPYAQDEAADDRAREAPAA